MLLAACVGAGVLADRLLGFGVDSGWQAHLWVRFFGPLVATLVVALVLTVGFAGVIVSLAAMEVALVLLHVLDVLGDLMVTRIMAARRRG